MHKILLVSLLAIVISGCSSMNSNTLNQNNLENVDFSSNFTKGEACEKYFLFFGPFGSSSVMDAAKSAKIKKVSLVEQESSSYIFYGTRCTIVYGK